MKIQRAVLAAALLGGAAGAAAVAPALAPAELLRVMRLEPGRWQTSARILDLQVRPATPGATLPPGAAEAARATIGMTQTSDSCIGTGLAADGALVLPGMRIGARGCRYETLEAAGGRLRLVGGCGQADASFLTEMRIDATYTPTRMAGTVTSSAYSQANGGVILRTSLSFDSTHAGACR